ncbi:LytR C-terminal domain-containing protein [Arthrobacter sp.]|uniref:LytR C-terminal domain-containing protein n=1 Tax=Arthrobacter sp. TaxID=1667 RepID=UPI003A94E122
MTKYPNDEFDRVPEFTNRKGVHRQAITGTAVRRSPLGWIVGFGILALVVGLFSFFVLPQLTGNPVATTAEASSSAPAAPSASATDDAGASSTDAASNAASEEPGASESAAAASSKAAAESAAQASKAAASSSEAAASSSAAASEPDLSAKVGVYNGSRRSGLAAAGKSTLSGAGFTNVSAANWTKKVNTSIVYYASDADKATAQKAASALGINAMYQTTQIPGKIAVVLGSDF